MIPILIDSGVDGNFISPVLINILKIPWKAKDKPYILRTADGLIAIYNNGIVGRETDYLSISIEG